VVPSATLVEPPEKPVSVPWVLAKWFLVCGISAGPSFLLGLIVANSQLSQIAGMLAGVITFIIAYTILECHPKVRVLIRKRFVRTTARIGYGMRMLVSVVFPLGAYLDISTGILSIGIVNFFFGVSGTGRGEFGNQFDSPIISFLWFYSTTLIQGLFLNIILLVFMLVVYGIAVFFGRPKLADYHRL